MSNKYEKYLLLQRFNESAGHFFVIQDVKQYLEKKGIKVQTFTTVKPDIIFEYQNKKYAIEVETGLSIRKHNDRLSAKVKELNKNYSNWFFVVTDKAYVSKYKQLGKTIDNRYLRQKLNEIIK